MLEALGVLLTLTLLRGAFFTHCTPQKLLADSSCELDPMMAAIFPTWLSLCWQRSQKPESRASLSSIGQQSVSRFLNAVSFSCSPVWAGALKS